jgi:hypothetical protein
MSAPSAWALQQAMATLQALRHDEAIADDNSELLSAIEAGEQDIMDLLRRVTLAATEAAAMSDMAKARMEELASRKARFDARDQAYRRTLFAAMDAMGEQKLSFPEATVSIGKPRAGLVITDEAELPEEYIRVTRAPDKAKLSEALKNGVVVTGAMVANGTPTLTVRTR